MKERPWYRNGVGAWYVQVGGKQVRLAKGPRDETAAAAWAAYHEMMARPDAGRSPAAGPTCAEACDAYFRHAGATLKESTLDRQAELLAAFQAALGATPAAELRPIDVLRWHETRAGWGPSTRALCCRVLKRAFRWAHRSGLLAANPLEFLESPRALPGGPAIPGAVVRAMLAQGRPSPSLRDLVAICHETGCRGGEAARVTAADVDGALGAWVLRDHKTAGKSGRPRVVYLPPRAAEITRRLCEARPEGPIFRNARGRPWTLNTRTVAFRRLCDRARAAGVPVPDGATLHGLRKGLATDALEAGVPPAVVAAWLGHDVSTLARHYDRVGDRPDTLRSHLSRVRPGPGPGGTPEAGAP